MKNPAKKPAEIYHADADPRIDEAARLVINEGIGPVKAARRVFGNGLTKKELESKRVSIAKRAKSLGGSTVGKPMPVGAVWSQIDEYQLCARCGCVMPQFDRGDVPSLIPGSDIALAIPIVTGLQVTGYCGKSMWSFLCFECATGDRSKWPGRWKNFMKAARTHTAAMQRPLDDISDKDAIWKKLWLGAISPRSVEGEEYAEPEHEWHLESRDKPNSRKHKTKGDRIIAKQPVTLTVRGR